MKNKSIILTLIVSLFIGIASGSSNMTQQEYEKLVSNMDSQVSHIAEIDKLIAKEKETNAVLVSEKEEKERIAKAEAERLAKEAAEKKKSEEEAAKNNSSNNTSGNVAANSGNNNTSSGNTVTNRSEEAIGEMVWLSETGNKYHSKNNCGRMNPNRARQVTLKQAQSRYERCDKCW
ncbi:hypothetical protein NSA50_19545 [Clostridium sp. DSM 100503]|uniref:hypothetical protein n=1 Tax=Clostridium sp. DSM 100503 TaxID=2963282 RepID=UPI00214A556E|nr:hypothetical protein [Clostridium sp. DSM 100503]MCR1953183.1 hypothetical protein [Clostridium sp. DSM 100503]